MKYTINHDTPLPERGAKASWARKSSALSIVETLRAMPADRNSSFLVPLKGRKVAQVRGLISSAIYAVVKDHPERKFTTRLYDKEKGIRVWRVE